MWAARAGIALAAACLCLNASGSALAKSKKHKHREHKSHHGPLLREHEASEPDTDGKAHLKRANALADKGDCQSAIDEYTKAYELLNDPVVLFNRGECFRRVGDTDPAIDDYREFLEKVPNAPNRAAIEAKIAAMETPESSVAKSPPPPAVGKSPPPAVAKSPPPPAVGKSPPPPGVAKSPPPDARPEPAPPTEAATARAPTSQPPASPSLAENNPGPVVALRRAPPPVDAAHTGGTRPWVWVALSVLAVGAGVAGFLVFRPHDQAPPDTALGNYRF
jgi:tetratricopeptide (TPR) repeat protein